MKRRVIYAFCFLALLMIEVIIGAFIRDTFVRPYLGDFLVVILVYCFIRVFIPKSLCWLPVYIFVFTCFIEVLQYFQLADTLVLSDNGLARIVLGSTFDFKDILCYAVGCIALLLVEYFERRAARSKRESRSLIGYKSRTHWYV